jgi:hypothetical protein
MFRFTFAPEGVCRKIHLCGSLCDLRAFVVKVFTCNFTTELSMRRGAPPKMKSSLT